MKLTVLASGSSGNCYVLEGRTSALIIECGVAPERAFQETHIQPSKVSGCLISHEHGDHAAFADRYTRYGMRVFASMGTIRAAGLSASPRVLSLQALRPAIVGEFVVTPFNVYHDAAEPLGFLVTHPELGKLLFATDTVRLDCGFRGINHILIEANWSEAILDKRVGSGEEDVARAARIKSTHLSLERACDYVRQVDNRLLENVVLLHLSDRNSDEEKFRETMSFSPRLSSVYVARPGLKIELENANFYERQ